jgi:hypothetical protein
MFLDEKTKQNVNQMPIDPNAFVPNASVVAVSTKCLLRKMSLNHMFLPKCPQITIDQKTKQHVHHVHIFWSNDMALPVLKKTYKENVCQLYAF